jgi:hypothetical protein
MPAGVFRVLLVPLRGYISLKDNQFNDPTIVGQKTSKPALVNAEGPALIDQKTTLTSTPRPPILLLR